MPTGFSRAQVANLRILWRPLGTLPDFRDGVLPAGNAVVIEAFMKGAGRQEVDMNGIKAGTKLLSGYVTRFATPPNPAGWLTLGSGWTWSDTGSAPEGFAAGARGEGFYGNLLTLPTIGVGAERGQVMVTDMGGTFGVGGIGASLRAENALGDAITVAFGTVL